MKKILPWCALAAAVALAAALPPDQSNGSSIDMQEVAQQAGVHFVIDNAPTPKKYMIETMAGGLSVFDFDGDGKPDLFFTNGAAVPALVKSKPEFHNRLYRNDGAFHFSDVTEHAGLAGEGYSMSAAAADYDNDSHIDLFVGGVNQSKLYHNRGDGTFEDVTAKSGIIDSQWIAAAGWFDFDNDGKLDLLLVHYSDTPLQDRFCGDKSRSLRVYCHPKYFSPLASTLYRNLGNGRFEDVSKKSGIAQFKGRGMSVAFADYDGDGYQDAFVTNDNMPNFLFHNKGDGTFEEVGLTAGVALGDRGQPVASMGVDFRDYDNDGLPDIAFTALAGETFPLYRNSGHGLFLDTTYLSKLGKLSLPHSGWGISMADLDNDGWKDLITAGAHVNDLAEQFESHPYRESNRIFRNRAGQFEEATPKAMEARIAAHRGLAVADFDGDGSLDAVVSSLGSPAELWHNSTTPTGHWIEFHLQGKQSNRDGIGARIRIGNQWNQMTSAVSYASSSLTPVHFGLGAKKEVVAVEIRWPSGRVQNLQHVTGDQILNVQEPDR